MRLNLQCTGGFTGPAGAQTRSVDLAKLPPAQSAKLRQMLVDCDFFALPETLTKPQPQSWDFVYNLQVDGDGDSGAQSHSVRYHLDAAPPPLRKLTEKLNEVAPG